MCFFVTFSTITFGQNLERKKLVPIQTESHNNPIEVFYPGDKPSKKYYQIALLETNLNANNTYVEVINDLKTQAQQMGMDAIILIKLQLTTQSTVDWEGFSSQYNVKEGIAFGIKYDLDFSYLKDIPKVESVYVYSDTAEIYKLAGVMNYDLYNNIIDYTYPKSLYDYKYKYSIQHLLHEQLNWTTEQTKQGQDKRTYKNGEKTCWFEYDSLDRVKNIKVLYRINSNGYTTTNTQKVKLTYDEQGRLHKKLIYPSPKNEDTYYVEVFRYDDFNRLTEKQLFLNFEGDLRPITKSFITEYYSEEVFRKMYPELKLRG
ncbi:MAG: hypothetical protein AB8G11_01060 [Saprospiraceae bacterium]